jgi:hypothetical protein
MTDNKGIIYLVQPSVLFNTNRYKIGYSARCNLDRINSYGRNVTVFFINSCDNPIIYETIIKEEFNKKFKLISGKEYFEGDVNEMKKCIFNIFTQDISTYSKIIEKYNNKEEKTDSDNDEEELKNSMIQEDKDEDKKETRDEVISDHLCEYCNKVFSTKGNCNNHKMKCKIKNKNELEYLRRENNNLKNLIGEEHECKYCDRAFSRKANCVRHELTCKSKGFKKEKDELIEILKKREEELKIKEEKLELYNSLILKGSIKKSKDKVIEEKEDTKDKNNSRDIVAKLNPVDFENIKNNIHNYNEEYIDEGIEGFVKFIFFYECNDKIITTDSIRGTIAYKTNKKSFVRDPKCSHLVNKIVNDVGSNILDKAKNRITLLINNLNQNIEEENKKLQLKILQITKLIDALENNDLPKKSYKYIADFGLNIYQKFNN